MHLLTYKSVKQSENVTNYVTAQKIDSLPAAYLMTTCEEVLMNSILTRVQMGRLKH